LADDPDGTAEMHNLQGAVINPAADCGFRLPGVEGEIFDAENRSGICVDK
jgi:hypothetical protein